MIRGRLRSAWHLLRGHAVEFDDWFEPPLWWCESCKAEWSPR